MQVTDKMVEAFYSKATVTKEGTILNFKEAFTAALAHREAEAVAGIEKCKLYHSRWPTADLLKAREPGGLITDDGEAWKYQYTHSDAQGGTYDLVYRPVAIPPAERSADPEFETDPDNGTPHEILAYLLDCAKRWVPEARIVGNARAGDIERALEAILTPPEAVTVERLFQKCDGWGAGEWFDRLAMAIHNRDKAVVAGNDLEFQTYDNIAKSSAARLVHDFENDVRSALATPAPADERVAEALREAAERFDEIRAILIEHLEEPERTAFWKAVNGREFCWHVLAKEGR